MNASEYEILKDLLSEAEEMNLELLRIGKGRQTTPYSPIGDARHLVRAAGEVLGIDPPPLCQECCESPALADRSGFCAYCAACIEHHDHA